jgi:hypothetical protein
MVAVRAALSRLFMRFVVHPRENPRYGAATLALRTLRLDVTSEEEARRRSRPAHQQRRRHAQLRDLRPRTLGSRGRLRFMSSAVALPPPFPGCPSTRRPRPRCTRRMAPVRVRRARAFAARRLNPLSRESSSPGGDHRERRGRRDQPRRLDPHDAARASAVLPPVVDTEPAHDLDVAKISRRESPTPPSPASRTTAKRSASRRCGSSPHRPPRAAAGRPDPRAGPPPLADRGRHLAGSSSGVVAAA